MISQSLVALFALTSLVSAAPAHEARDVKIEYHTEIVYRTTFVQGPIATPTAAAASAPVEKPVQEQQKPEHIAPQPQQQQPEQKQPEQKQPEQKQDSGSKRGLAWHPERNDRVFETVSKNVGWWYNWQADPFGYNEKTSAPYYYTQHGRKDIENVANRVPNGATLIGFNEPDHAAQANMNAGEAAELYRQYLIPLVDSKQIRLGSPSVTNGPGGMKWLQDFMNACADCKISFINLHWYGPDFAQFKGYMEDAHSKFPNLPVWITELGCTNWDISTNPGVGAVQDFMGAATSYADNTEWIQKYAWFGSMTSIDQNLENDRLMNADASLTPLGHQYFDM